MGIDRVEKRSLGILENIFHNAKVGIAICNGESHIIEMVNSSFATIYGYEPYELIGVFSSKVFPPECMVRLATLQDTQDELLFETVHYKKDGTPVNVSVHITVLKDEYGVVQQRIANIIDITEQVQAKYQLEETQAKLTSIISTIPDMIWMKDTNGFYLACNDALEQFLGTKEDELLGKTDYDFFPKENADICKFSDNAALQSNKMSITAESFIHPKDGEAGVLEIRKVPVLKDDGEIMGVLGIGRDITERKRQEEYLNKTKAKLAAIITTIPDLIWVKDINGIYLMCNPAFERFFGASCEEILGKTDYDFLGKEQADFFRQRDQEVLEEGKISINEEEIIFADSGQYVLLETRKMQIYFNNEFMGVLGISRDITEQKRMEKKISENELRLNEAQKVAKIGSWEVEYPNLNLHWSDEVYRIFEFTSCDLEPSYEYFLNGIHPDDRELVGSTYTKSVQTHTPYDLVHRLLMKDGRIKYVQERGETIYDKDGQPLKSIGTVQDITEKMKVEKELQFQSEQLFKSEKMVAMGEMIGNIAHQWRQPLSVISAITSGIAVKKELGILKEEELLPYMDQILTKTEYLSKTIDDFRNFMKGEKEENICNIASLFEKTLSIVDSGLKANYIKLITHIDGTLEIRGYENELMQAFINIINNAKDALVENETIKVKYIFIEAKSKNNQYEISIKDNGGGIQPSVINRIFVPYFTTKHKSQGTGLGLAMTYKIITEVHKGTITASNETYKYCGKEYTGASFTIRFL